MGLNRNGPGMAACNQEGLRIVVDNDDVTECSIVTLPLNCIETASKFAVTPRDGQDRNRGAAHGQPFIGLADTIPLTPRNA